MRACAQRPPVPDLTSFADIQLNARVSLQIRAKAKHNHHPTTSGRKSISPWGRSVSGTPNQCQKHRTTSLISLNTLRNSIKNSWRFECESAKPNALTKSAPMSVLRQKPVILPGASNWPTSGRDDPGETRLTRRAQSENPRSASRSEAVRPTSVVASPVPSTFAMARLDSGTLDGLLDTVAGGISPDAPRPRIAD